MGAVADRPVGSRRTKRVGGILGHHGRAPIPECEIDRQAGVVHRHEPGEAVAHGGEIDVPRRRVDVDQRRALRRRSGRSWHLP